MRGRWRYFQNRHTEKAIMVSACNSKMVSIEITLWLLLAGITMSFSSCSGGKGESVPLQTSFARQAYFLALARLESACVTLSGHAALTTP